MFSRVARSLSLRFAPFLFLALAVPRAEAQCGLADGLDGGPCCAATFATLPQIPAFQTDARFICFDNCGPSLNNLYCANLGPPIPMQSGGMNLCGAYFIRLRLKICGTTNFVWLGALNAMYSRNWLESSVPGTVNLTVWRFIVNGDFLPTALLPNTPCDKPGCTVQFTRVYFSGHIDYAYDCITNTWSVAFAINHECDGIHHQPGTARPAPAGGFHPTRSFSIVGPGSTFAVASTNPIRSDGPISQEAIRWNTWGPPPFACNFEERAMGNFQALNDVCFCFTASPNLQYAFTNVTAFGSCGSSINPSGLGPFMQKRIGRWTSGTQFPGVEFVLFDVGHLVAVNGCTGITSNEWFEGSETIRGFPAFDLAGVPLDAEFEDLGSANNSITNPAVKIGAPHVSNCILNFNLP